MKTMIFLATTIIFSFVANARITYELSVNGALAKVKLRVVDQDGSAVYGARIWGGFSANFSNDSVLVEGFTNTNGEFVVQGKCNEFLRVDVTKEGYYHTEEKINFLQAKADPIVVDGKWQPYGETHEVVLKKIKNPWAVKVFGENIHRHDIPVFDEWIDFDLEAGDWLPPYGAGKFSDVALRFNADIRKPRIDYTYRMEVSFTNNPHGGAYILKKDLFSNLQTAYIAETNGIYASELTFTTDCISDKPVRLSYLDRDSYLVFRTRTRVDDQGMLVGAHYGKICGIWRSTQKMMLINDGCFNPVENDPNIEGDQTLLYTIKGCKNYTNKK